MALSILVSFCGCFQECSMMPRPNTGHRAVVLYSRAVHRRGFCCRTIRKQPLPSSFSHSLVIGSQGT